jgi:hypothetical protein
MWQLAQRIFRFVIRLFRKSPITVIELGGYGADDRLRSGDLGDGDAALYHLSYICMEPPTGIGPRDLGRTRTVLCH